MPLIAFNDFSGTAGDVTARSVNGHTILTVRPFPNKVYSPSSQKEHRNFLSKVSRAYKKLDESQGMPLLVDAPENKSDVPEVEYEDRLCHEPLDSPHAGLLWRPVVKGSDELRKVHRLDLAHGADQLGQTFDAGKIYKRTEMG